MTQHASREVLRVEDLCVTFPSPGGAIHAISGVEIALWDIAGKITGYPIYRLLGGPIRKNIPVYSHGGPADMLDKPQCKAWADQVKSAPEGFTAFKFGFGAPGGRPPRSNGTATIFCQHSASARSSNRPNGAAFFTSFTRPI